MESYRVFISHSHEDAELAESIASALHENGLTPLWDRHLSFGRGFDSQIKTFIAHAHVFLPVITARSSARGWVHQEIGYATALRVPVLPVCQGQLPGEMLQMLHAVGIGNDPTAIKSQLARGVFEDLVLHVSSDARPLHECAMLPEDRSTLMSQYADQVRQIRIGDERAHGFVRQKAALESFGIPNKHLSHPDWATREGSLVRSTHRRECLSRERKSLQLHAQSVGCRLILNPWLDYDEKHGPGATYVRLQTMVDFLEWNKLPLNNVEVAIRSGGTPHSLTIVGDWFLSESVAAEIGRGYQQTMFTRHAPSVRDRIASFDQEFYELLEQSSVTPSTSREAAIELLRERMTQVSCSS